MSFLKFHFNLFTLYISSQDIFVLIPHNFDYYCFIVLSEVLEGYVSSFVIFPHDCFHGFLMKFRIICSGYVKNVMDDFKGIALNP